MFEGGRICEENIERRERRRVKKDVEAIGRGGGRRVGVG